MNRLFGRGIAWLCLVLVALGGAGIAVAEDEFPEMLVVTYFENDTYVQSFAQLLTDEVESPWLWVYVPEAYDDIPLTALSLTYEPSAEGVVRLDNARGSYEGLNVSALNFENSADMPYAFIVERVKDGSTLWTGWISVSRSYPPEDMPASYDPDAAGAPAEPEASPADEPEGALSQEGEDPEAAALDPEMTGYCKITRDGVSYYGAPGAAAVGVFSAGTVVFVTEQQKDGNGDIWYGCTVVETDAHCFFQATDSLEAMTEEALASYFADWEEKHGAAPAEDTPEPSASGGLLSAPEVGYAWIIVPETTLYAAPSANSETVDMLGEDEGIYISGLVYDGGAAPWCSVETEDAFGYIYGDAVRMMTAEEEAEYVALRSRAVALETESTEPPQETAAPELAPEATPAPTDAPPPQEETTPEATPQPLSATPEPEPTAPPESQGADPAQEGPATQMFTYARVKLSEVNFRKEPHGQLIRRVPKGTLALPLAEELAYEDGHGWLMVQIDDEIGYLREDMFEFTEVELELPPQVPTITPEPTQEPPPEPLAASVPLNETQNAAEESAAQGAAGDPAVLSIVANSLPDVSSYVIRDFDADGQLELLLLKTPIQESGAYMVFAEIYRMNAQGEVVLLDTASYGPVLAPSTEMQAVLLAQPGRAILYMAQRNTLTQETIDGKAVELKGGAWADVPFSELNGDPAALLMGKADADGNVTLENRATADMPAATGGEAVPEAETPPATPEPEAAATPPLAEQSAAPATDVTPAATRVPAGDTEKDAASIVLQTLLRLMEGIAGGE